MAYDESDYWFDQRVAGMKFSQDEKKYAHWDVKVTFKNGFEHRSSWHAERSKAREIVVQEAKILHERKFGNRGGDGYTVEVVEAV